MLRIVVLCVIVASFFASGLSLAGESAQKLAPQPLQTDDYLAQAITENTGIYDIGLSQTIKAEYRLVISDHGNRKVLFDKRILSVRFPFLVTRGRIYYGVYCGLDCGVKIVCDSLDAGENVWTKELNPINAAHSKYFNEVSMNWDAAGNPLVIGKESAGCYRMTVDVKMGGTIDSVVMVPR